MQSLQRGGGNAPQTPRPGPIRWPHLHPLAQVSGLSPLAALSQHLADPLATTIFSKAVVIPGQAVVPACAIPATQAFQGINIPTPCFLQALWP